MLLLTMRDRHVPKASKAHKTSCDGGSFSHLHCPSHSVLMPVIFSPLLSSSIVVLRFARMSDYITVTQKGRFSDLAPAAKWWEVTFILPHLLPKLQFKMRRRSGVTSGPPMTFCSTRPEPAHVVRDFSIFTEWKKCDSNIVCMMVPSTGPS